MDGLRVPPNPCFHKQFASTPDYGLIYLSGHSKTIAHVSPPVKSEQNPVPLPINLIAPKNEVLAIDCDPNWTKDRKHFAVLENNFYVYIWNLYDYKQVSGHMGHQQSNPNPNSAGAICYTANDQVLSIVDKLCVKYCVKSNTYLKYQLNPKCASIRVIKVCPYDENLVATGTKRGLIILMDAKDFSVLYTLRGHDSEILSIDWMKFTANLPIASQSVIVKKASSKDKKKRRPRPQADTSDLFDIYSFDHLEDEFGTMIDKKVTAMYDPNIETNTLNNDKFDFVEACQTLKDDILLGTTTDTSTESNVEVKSNDIVNQNDSVISSSLIDEDDDNEPDSSSHEFEEINETFDETIDNDDEEVLTNEPEIIQTVVEKFCIASSSALDNHVWLWDAKTGVGMEKIEMKRQQKQYHHQTKGKKEVFTGNIICWLNNSMLAVLSLSEGAIFVCNVSWIGENKFTVTKRKIAFETKLEVCIVRNRSNLSETDLRPTIWTFTTTYNRQLIFGDIHTNILNIQAIYSTTPLTNYAIQECPHDPNKIAFGGNGLRFHIFNVTNITPNDFQFVTYTKNIHSKILAMAWHPNDEKYLAYSTSEGIIALIDTSKYNNSGVALTQFSGNAVYQISWGSIDRINQNVTNDDAADQKECQKQCVLFACSKGKLVYYLENNNHKMCNNFVPINDLEGVSSVSAGKYFIAIGIESGGVALYSLKLKVVWYTKISNKYITECAWSPIAPNRLAVSSLESDIYLFTTCSTDASKDIVHEDGKLIGHQLGVNMVKWSQHNEDHLVSCGMDGTVRVWDTKKFECIALVTYSNRMHFATFSPNDANLILATGLSETMHIFDLRNHLFNNEINQTNSGDATAIEWAKEICIKSGKEIAKEKKKQKKRQTILDDNGEIASTSATAITPISNDLKNVDELLSEAMESVSLAPIQLTYSTILHLSSKDFNKNPIKCLRSLMEPESDEKPTLHTHLYSTRNDVKKLLEIELKNHKDSNTLSIASVLIPQMCGNLKMEILKNVESKTLTEQHISLAPSISFEFWKNCCKSYAFQCIEKNMTLLAIPYLLGCHEITESIDSLCDAHFYREAWILAKLYKDADDINCFNLITNKWINYLESKGNLECAALVAASVEDYGTAIRMLSKRRNPCEETNIILEWMAKQSDLLP